MVKKKWMNWALKRFAVVTVLAVQGVSAQQYRPAHPIHPLFERAFPDEGRLIEKIVQGILRVQQASKASDGKLYRGTHAKGVCARAIFEVQPVEDTALRVGLFANRARYSALVRFANADSKIGDDREPDVRSMSISVDLGNDVGTPPFVTNRQDFSFNNSPTFPINDIGAFAALFVKRPSEYLNQDWTNIASKDFLKSLVSEDFWSLISSAYKGYQQKTRPKRGYQKMRFWSGVPFLAGENNAVKYVVTPCKENPSMKLQDDANQLSIEFKRHLAEDQKMSCYSFGLQKLNANVMTDGLNWYLAPNYLEPKDWVENASIQWSPLQAPVQSVARITFVPKSALTDAECESQYFSVGINTLPAHRGLGSINRARTMAEWASLQARKH